MAMVHERLRDVGSFKKAMNRETRGPVSRLFICVNPCFIRGRCFLLPFTADGLPCEQEDVVYGEAHGTGLLRDRLGCGRPPLAHPAARGQHHGGLVRQAARKHDDRGG